MIKKLVSKLSGWIVFKTSFIVPHLKIIAEWGCGTHPFLALPPLYMGHQFVRTKYTDTCKSAEFGDG